MQSFKKLAPVVGEIIINYCPHCQIEPDLEVSVGKPSDFSGYNRDSITYLAKCKKCGLSAPLNIWNGL